MDSICIPLPDSLPTLGDLFSYLWVALLYWIRKVYLRVDKLEKETKIDIDLGEP